MNDELVETPEPSETPEPQYNEVEVKAMEQGWLPKEQWVESGRSEDEWRSAREFKDRGELLGTIHSLKRENKQVQQALTSLQKHHQFVFDQAHRKALAELKAERRQALLNEDPDRVEAIEEQIVETTKEYETAKAELVNQPTQIQAGELHPDFISWTERNTWYNQDSDLRDEADAIGMVYTKRNPGADPRRVLEHVEKEIRRKNPEKFGAKRTAPNAVIPPNRSGTRKATEAYQLNEVEEKIANDLVRAGVMTREEYIKELKKVKGE